MPRLDRLPTRTAEGAFRVVVESPRGAQAKLKYEPELQAFTLSRPLTTGLVYPYDWGFVPSTRAADGDPLDAMVLLDVPTYPGVVLECRALGVLSVTQRGEKGREHNDRVIAVPVNAPRSAKLGARLRAELEHFFVAAVALEHKELRIEGWKGARAAERLVDASRTQKR